MAQREQHHVAVIGDLRLGGFILEPHAAGADIVGLAARLGAGGSLGFHKGQVVRMDMSQRGRYGIAADGAGFGSVLSGGTDGNMSVLILLGTADRAGVPVTGFIADPILIPLMTCRRDLLLLGQHCTADGALAALRQAGFRAGSFLSGNGFGGVALGGNLFLLGQHRAAHGALAALRQAGFRAGSFLPGDDLGGVALGGADPTVLLDLCFSGSIREELTAC